MSVCENFENTNFPEFYFNKNFTGKPKWFLCFLSHQMQIVRTIIFFFFWGGEKNVSDFICDANESIWWICMVRYRVRDLTNRSQGGGRGPHRVQWEPPQSVPLPSGFVEARSVADFKKLSSKLLKIVINSTSGPTASSFTNTHFHMILQTFWSLVYPGSVFCVLYVSHCSNWLFATLCCVACITYSILSVVWWRDTYIIVLWLVVCHAVCVLCVSLYTHNDCLFDRWCI